LASSDSVILGRAPILGHEPSTNPLFSSGFSSAGLNVFGAHDQHNHGHSQLAQQITGVMSHTFSGLTVFGPSALHFYSGFPHSTAGIQLFGSPMHATDPLSPQQQVSPHHPSPPLPIPVSVMPDYPHSSLLENPHIYTPPIVSLPPPPLSKFTLALPPITHHQYTPLVNLSPSKNPSPLELLPGTTPTYQNHKCL
jgi:hypothetical protein